ncbi:FKBP-type peptidyl-prolyl cis-trans isomerase [Elongatibacter sediminis]|uniref:Peptidyl-prolyl cis-trans isomerase n=1 Tax=Elongatibacter sediminis TaxID=3119006 RepID=A0AAW9RH00_9GAMM
MNITENSVVRFHYTLTDAAGSELESSREGEPMSYLHGAGNIIPGLEKALEGRGAGDTFQVTIEPAEAYGEKAEPNIQRVSAKHFRDPRKLKPGQVIGLQTREGPVQVTVVKVGRFNVDVDASHPLAGQTLTFDIEIVEVRESSTEEQAHGHVHGPGGVQH